MKHIISLNLLCILFCVYAPLVESASTSKLYGSGGELWKATGPLSDYSYAGYAANTRSLPKPSVIVSVKNVGAKGDGRTDDTAAFEGALSIAQEKKGAIFIPEGTYVITRKLSLNFSGVVLRGAGQDKTILYFPKSLRDVQGPRGTAKKSSYSYREGFLQISGGENKQKLADVAKPTARGSRRLYVSSTQYLKTGMWVRLFMSDQGGSLFRYLYANQPGDISDLLNRPDVVRFSSRIAAVGPDYIDLERPLAHDIKLEWKPEVHSLTNSVQNVGIEDLTIKFKSVDYAGHQKDPGYNGIFAMNAMNIFISRVTVLNADNAVMFVSVDFSSVNNVTVGMTRDRSNGYGVQGHHALSFGACTEVDVSGFNIKGRWDHDILAEWYSFNVIFHDGKGYDLSIDLHRGGPHAVMFANLNMGLGKRVYDIESGADIRGRHSAANTTFWNLYKSSGGSVSLPPCDYGTMLTFVGNFAGSTCSSSKWRVERLSSGVSPSQIQSSMVKTRSFRMTNSGGPDIDYKGADPGTAGSSAFVPSTGSPGSFQPTTSPSPSPSSVSLPPSSPSPSPTSTVPTSSPAPAGLEERGSYRLKTVDQPSAPYLTVSSSGTLSMSSSPQTWKRYIETETFDYLFTANGKWLSNDGWSKCSSLQTYGTYDSPLRHFELVLLEGTSPRRYFLTTKCSEETSYATKDLRLTRSKDVRAEWVLEAP